MEADFRVQFVIGGAQKGGTTALYSYLVQHPGLFMPPHRKELHFFDKPGKHARGVRRGYENYHKHFVDAAPGQVCGEATPAYMYMYDVPRRIWEYNPSMKWLIVLRNPISRAYSHWNMLRERGREPLAFGEALRQERERCRTALPDQHRAKSYVDRGYYVEQLRRVWHCFPPDQVHVIKSDRLRAEPAVVIDEVCAFIGVEPMEGIESLSAHVREYPAPMEPATRALLLRTYEFEIRQLERVLGWDCSDWLEDAAEPAPDEALATPPASA